MTLSPASSSTPALDETKPLSGHSRPVKSKRQREVHALQVRAFLDAADEVDIDQEIAVDILEGFDGDAGGADFDDEVDVEADEESSTGTALVNTPENDDDDEDWEGADDDDSSEADMLEEKGEVSVIFSSIFVRVYGRETRQ